MAKNLSVEEILNASKDLPPAERERLFGELEKLRKERRTGVESIESLVKAGLLDRNHITYPWDRPPLPELLNLPGKPLSEIVIEDRGES
ncbi:MAG: hypothetical protein HYR55_13800 [Acidobacteria bacterium]|nr:hypothetical protein [Acidobacteriota bacterium]MBI3658689.1 hypothetical protein [Acidobacteriota bacterium]